MTKTLRRLAATLCLVALPALAMAQTTTATPPASPAPPAGDPVVAKVNGKELHRSDVVASADLEYRVQMCYFQHFSYARTGTEQFEIEAGHATQNLKEH